MRFLGLRVQDFRNIPFAGLEFAEDRVFLLGGNGQGKSNLLEALGFFTALRSFRTRDTSALARRGAAGFALRATLEREGSGRETVEIRSEGGARRVWVDDAPVSRLGDFIGRFPVVPLSSDDRMLLRGAPGDRRRFLDLTLSASDPEYYRRIRAFHRGLAGRNRLLKKGASDGELAAFEAEVAPHAAFLTEARRAACACLGAHLAEAYAVLADEAEGPSLAYRPSLEEGADAGAYARALAAGRARERVLGATAKGPHRDDIALSTAVGGAREYASDGQQRALCVALRLAQARLFEERLGVAPVLLADDVLGEMEPARRAGFWRACPAEAQVFASGTELPAGGSGWRVIDVVEGGFGERTATDNPSAR